MWTGDNLDIMRGMNGECVDLIYLDPPFNSNEDYNAPVGSDATGAAFKDTWTLSDVDEAWHGETADKEPAQYAIIDAAKERSAPLKRRIGLLALSLLPVLCLGLVNLSFSDDPIRLESWRQRPNEGNFAQRIAGVYLIRHYTDEGTPSSFRLISLTAGGNWASTHSDQHDRANPARFSDQHGVWARSGWRNITAEVVDFNLDAATGAHTDIVRARYVVQFSKDLQSITGTQVGRVFPLDQDPFDPDAVPAIQFDSTFSGRRVTVEAD